MSSCPPHEIDVLFRDGTLCRVLPKALSLLLKHNEIFRFRRSSGWVTVGIDPIREEADDCSLYGGPERRRTHLFCT